MRDANYCCVINYLSECRCLETQRRVIGEQLIGFSAGPRALIASIHGSKSNQPSSKLASELRAPIAFITSEALF